MNTVQLLDAVKRRNNLPSDYAAARFFGVSLTAVSNWRNKKTNMGEKQALLAAVALELQPGQVLAWMRAERSPHAPAKKVWRELAKLAGVSVIVGVFVLAPGTKSAYPDSANNIHYANYSICDIQD